MRIILLQMEIIIMFPIVTALLLVMKQITPHLFSMLTGQKEISSSSRTARMLHSSMELIVKHFIGRMEFSFTLAMRD